MIAYAALTQISSQQWRSSYVRLPAVGLVPANGVIAGLLAGGLCVTWAVWHNAIWSWPLQVGAASCSSCVAVRHQPSCPHAQSIGTPDAAQCRLPRCPVPRRTSWVCASCSSF